MATVLENLSQPRRAALVERSGSPARSGVSELCGPQVNYPRNKCIHELFEAQVEKAPDAIAVAFEEQQMTYSELDARANAVAAQLRECGVGPEVRAGICIGRSLEMIIGLLAILKAGGAYVPVDPNYPQERIAFMLRDAQAPVLLTQRNLLGNLPPTRAHVICLDDQTNLVSSSSPYAPRAAHHANAENLAYVLFTSGSTGQPKGVQITHRNVVNFFAGMDRAIGNEPGVWLAVTSISFDISVLELFWTLTRGFKVVIQGEEWGPELSGIENQNPAVKRATNRRSLAGQILHHGVTHFQCTPSQAVLLVEDTETFKALRRLKKFLVGGEALPPTLAQRLAGCGELFNMYGPTETTVWSACAKLSPGAPVTIGSPLANTRIYLVDERLQPVANGEAGELLIGGDGVARGYLNRPELTAEKFIPDTFGAQSIAPHVSDENEDRRSDAPRSRLYRTGDLARFRAEGTIEFLGRLDHQVKVRGHRIELGEIEAVLAEHSLVRRAVVLAREDQPGDQRLVAYVVPRNGSADDESVRDQKSEAVVQWQTIWDGTYGQNGVETDPEFDLSGWRSSQTGQPIPAAEMREWVENTVERILALQPRRILEIGCGAGLLLFRLAPHCEHYCATDFSAAVIRRLETYLAGRASKLPVSLLPRAADELNDLAAASFDTVVLNSVAQYFPDTDYLLRVLEGAARVVKPGGHIFIGDVRNLALLEEFYTSIELKQAGEALTVAELKERIQRRASQEKELVFAPEFFSVLPRVWPTISRADIQLKRGRHQNELTRFRYDVVLRVGETATRLKPDAATRSMLSQLANHPSASFAAAQLPQQLRQHLKQKLPDFMTPSAFMILDELPLTPNGKIDRKALPRPAVGRVAARVPFAAAETDLEKTIAEIWRELLPVEQVGLNDNFFDLGGHSLLLAQVHARLKETLKTDLPIIKLFQYPTVQALAKFLGEQSREKSFEDVRERVQRQQATWSRAFRRPLIAGGGKNSGHEDENVGEQEVNAR